MTGLYAHIPFCRKKCFYCDFFSEEYGGSNADIYIDALISEALIYGKQRLDTVYIGGGTPSVLSLRQIEKFFRGLDNVFGFAGNSSEVTFEMNPESVSPDKLKLLKNCGINRLSIGLQSADTPELKLLGRVHDYDMFKKAFENARKEGFDNINVDLIYGLPGQSIADWSENLKKALLFGSEHISLYPLSVEENTVFYKNAVSVDGDIQRDMYEKASEMLERAGFNHYEISNWAKPGKEAAHNSNYWRNLEYIGIGAGASGYLGGFRYLNIENIKEYSDRVSKGISVKVENDFINDSDRRTEAIILGLRLLKEGVDEELFAHGRTAAVFEDLLKRGLLERDSGRVRLSKNAVFVSNSVLCEFIE